MLQVVVSGLVTVLLYGAVIAGVFKVFQIATDLGEMKEALLEIKRNTQDVLPPALSSAALAPLHSLANAVIAGRDPLSTDPVDFPR